MITSGALSVAFAWLALAPVDGVAKEALSTLLTMISSCVVETSSADSLFFIILTLHTSAVTIALASGTVCEVPSWGRTSVTGGPVPLVTPWVRQSASSVQGTTSSSFKTLA